ncbi:hypothetical protein CEXT_649481, partial [Caerostris extrusa]
MQNNDNDLCGAVPGSPSITTELWLLHFASAKKDTCFSPRSGSG